MNTSLDNLSTEKLLAFITQQQEHIVQLQERIKILENEITRLKKLNPKPDIKPNTKPSDSHDDNGNNNDDSQSHDHESDEEPESADSELSDRKSDVDKPNHHTKRQSTKPDKPPVTEEAVIAPDSIPEGSTRHGRDAFYVQELELHSKTICYWLEKWVTPEGKVISGLPPSALNGHHFGPQLRAFILHQYFACGVTQPQLLEFLWDIGVSISSGELSNLITKGHESFHQEKDELLATGIRCSRYLQTDDTGARHQGQNGYCTVITNELFTWFGTTESKSRENFLTLLHRPYRTYVLNAEAISYLREHKFAKKWQRILTQYQDVHFLSEKAWKAFMNDIGLTGSRNRQRASEAMLYGSLISHGFNLVTFSDGAGQFNVFAHAQCWVHAARPMEKVIPVNRQQVNAQYWCLSWFWDIYRDLKAFRESPSGEKAAEIRAAFKSLIQTQTGCSGLQEALAGLAVIEQELLMVLDNPVLPLHNNLSESQIREHVKRRKISGGTKSEDGRRSRDTFASLKKTCRQYGLSFWHYLTDRLTGSGTFPSLAQKIESAAQWLSCGSSTAF